MAAARGRPITAFEETEIPALRRYVLRLLSTELTVRSRPDYAYDGSDVEIVD